MKFLRLFLCMLVFACACHSGHCRAQDTPFRILASTFPVYLFTANVCANAPNVSIELLVPSAAGCPHDFTLRPADLQKLDHANALIINGAGLEEFLTKTLANRELPVIDAGAGLEILASADGHDHGNPHIFSSPQNAAKMVENIASGLTSLNPANATLYTANGQNYSSQLAQIGNELATIGANAKNPRIALEHGALAYLAKNAGLEITAIFENTTSVARLNSLKKELLANPPALLAGDSQYSDRLLKTLARETGLPFAMLNPCANGPENPPLDYYQQIMRENIATMREHFD